MQSIGIGALVIAYICAAYIGPVVALALAVYWAYQSVQTGGTMGGAFVTFVMSALVMLVALMIAKRVLKTVMNIVDPDDEAAAEASDE